MSKAASSEAMELLHAELAKTLTEAVKTVEVTYTEEVDGEEVERVRVERPSSSWAAVAVAFLKNNSVTMAPAQGNATGELESELERMRAKRTMPTAQDRADALAAIGTSLLQ
jgi:hypothetical protein